MSDSFNYIPDKKKDKNKLLGGSLTKGYRPTTLIYPAWYWMNQAFFSLVDVEAMRRDEQISLGLMFLKAPLFTLEWTVKSKNEQVAKYVDEMIKAFWRPHISKLLRAMEYGYAGGELIFRLNKQTGKIVFDNFKEFHPRDLRVLTRAQEFVGFRVKNLQNQENVDLFPPKGLWFTVNREFGGWYGRSLLINVWDSWYEKKSQDGARDIRRLWFYKNAFTGGVLRHPLKDYVMPDGSIYPSREMAREQAEKLKTGGVVTFPSTRDEKGEYHWQWQPPQFNGNAMEIRDYPKDLDGEILRGLGIPDSVLTENPGSGSYAGRRVPERAFYVRLEMFVAELMYSLRQQVIDHLVKYNFEGDIDYEIVTKPLIETMSPEGTPPPGAEQGQMPGQNQSNDGNTIGKIFDANDKDGMTSGTVPVTGYTPSLSGM